MSPRNLTQLQPINSSSTSKHTSFQNNVVSSSHKNPFSSKSDGYELQDLMPSESGDISEISVASLHKIYTLNNNSTVNNADSNINNPYDYDENNYDELYCDDPPKFKNKISFGTPKPALTVQDEFNLHALLPSSTISLVQVDSVPEQANNKNNDIDRKSLRNLPKEAGRLFPEISSNAYNLRNSENVSSDSRPPSVVHIIDDTASVTSINIDETEEPLESMAYEIIKAAAISKKKSQKNISSTQSRIGAILAGKSSINLKKNFKIQNNKNTEIELIDDPNGKDISAINMNVNAGTSADGDITSRINTNENPFITSSKPTDDSMDFENYKRQTANQILEERKRERREQRQLRRRLRALRKEQYFGNYFREQDPNLDGDIYDNIEFSHVSYAIDHFNGHRQENSHFYYNNTRRQNTQMEGNNRIQGMQAMSSGTSFRSYQTENIDDMSSDDSENSGNNHNNNNSNYENNFINGGSTYRTNTNADSSDNEDLMSQDSSSFDSDDSLGRPRGFYRYYLPRKGLKRKLYSRHLTSIGASSSVGISSMLMLGRTLFTSGPLGALLGYIITGGIVYSVVIGYGEMVSLIPLHTGVPGTVARFVNPSMGYAIGFCYWLSNAVALPAELTAGAMMLTNYKELAEHGAVIVWIIYILFLVLLINICSVRIYGEFQFVVNLVRMALIPMLFIVLIIVNVDPKGSDEVVGFRYWTPSKSAEQYGWYFGPFRPLFPVHIVLDSPNKYDEVVIIGIAGSLGRFVQVLDAISQASRAYLSVPIVYSSVGEARNPRKSLARATKYIFWQIIIFYIFAVFMLGINVYAGDTDLVGMQTKFPSEIDFESRYRSNQTLVGGCLSVESVLYNSYDMGLSVSPWIVALQTAGLCSFGSGINAAFVVFALSAGSAHLYAASRALYGLARMYIEEKKIRYPSWWNMCGWCNNQGVPNCAVFVSFPFALLALMTIQTPSFSVFQRLLVVSGSASVIVWIGMAISFIRFHKALSIRNNRNRFDDNEQHEYRERHGQRSQHSGGLSRNDLGYPFKSPFQPFLAWVGLVGSSFILLTQGFTVFIKGNWDGGLFVAAYISPVLFCVVYGFHWKLTQAKTVHVRNIDLDSGRKELDRAEWVEDRKYSSNRISAIWHWLLGRVRFIEVLLKTMRGDYSSHRNDDEATITGPNILDNINSENNILINNNSNIGINNNPGSNHNNNNNNIASGSGSNNGNDNYNNSNNNLENLEGRNKVNRIRIRGTR